MWAIIEAAGWPIWLIIVSSIVALAIILERAYSLRQSIVMPGGLLTESIEAYKSQGVNTQFLEKLSASPMGSILAAGLRQAEQPTDIIKESLEDKGRVVAVRLERYLTTLGTISAMAPLMGLLGTVIGMIEIFGAQSPTGANPHELAHGISVALYNTAMGLIVAIPSMMFYRYFRAKVDHLLVDMEAQALKLVEAIARYKRTH